MTVIQSFILGVIQGITEFLPISSSAHLALVPWMFGWAALEANPEIQKSFDAALHVGTFLAVTIYFRSTVWQLCRGFVRTLRNRAAETLEDRMVWYVIIASVPAAIIGFVGEQVIAEKLTQPWIMAITLTLFGLVMLVVDRYARLTRDLAAMRSGDAIFVGLAQAIALIPGTSRSGVTLTAGMLRGFTREEAIRFSFLMSIPITGGAAFYSLLKLVSSGAAGTTIGYAQLAVGLVTSFVVGYAAVAWLLQYLRSGTLVPFVVYRVALSLLIVVLIVTGARPATV
ncbi:MAG: undecaprenyl-diphosphatase UppP [Acidimicrobiia bacterium]|nr:undecaprenyl-diphosphatase UppP [Acidimicrobiia bacterium]